MILAFLSMGVPYHTDIEATKNLSPFFRFPRPIKPNELSQMN